MLLNVIKRKKSTQKNKRSCAKSNLTYNNYFTFYKYHNTNELSKLSLDSKLNNVKEFKDKLESFCYDAIEIKSNNEDQIKQLELYD